MDNLKRIGIGLAGLAGLVALEGCSSPSRNLGTFFVPSELEIREIEKSYITKKRLDTYRSYHSGTLNKVDYVAIAFDLVWKDTGRLKVNGNCIVGSLETSSVGIVEEGNSYYVCVSLDDLGIDYEVRLEKNLEFGCIEQK